MAPHYNLSIAAEKDWQNIVRYTLKNFGEKQVQKYTADLSKCLNDLASKKGHLRQIQIGKHDILVMHCKKHYIFVLTRLNEPLLVIAIFHERMDLMQRLKNRLS